SRKEQSAPRHHLNETARQEEARDGSESHSGRLVNAEVASPQSKTAEQNRGTRSQQGKSERDAFPVLSPGGRRRRFRSCWSAEIGHCRKPCISQRPRAGKAEAGTGNRVGYTFSFEARSQVAGVEGSVPRLIDLIRPQAKRQFARSARV